MPSRPLVRIFTAAVCSPRSGVGGWAAILASDLDGRHPVEMKGAEQNTTADRLELEAAVSALAALPCPCRAEVTTHSAYLRNAFTEGWLEPWPSDPWSHRRGDLANHYLGRLLVACVRLHDVAWKWAEGNSHSAPAERCRRPAAEVVEQLAAAWNCRCSGQTTLGDYLSATAIQHRRGKKARHSSDGGGPGPVTQGLCIAALTSFQRTAW